MIDQRADRQYVRGTQRTPPCCHAPPSLRQTLVRALLRVAIVRSPLYGNTPKDLVMKPLLLASLVSLALVSRLPAAEIVSTTNMDADGFQSTGTNVGIGYRSSDGAWTNESAAQEFFPEVGGTLGSITATVDKFAGGEPLHVSIYTSDLGFPDVHLGTVTVPESQISTWRDSTWQLNTFDLSSLAISLDPNQSYVVVFRTDTALYQSVRYRALRTRANASSYGAPALYSRDGQSWNVSSSADEIGLIVRVRETPPPPPVEVAIDVVPGSDANKISFKGKNPKPFTVALLSDAGFDAAEIDPSSALIGDPVLTDPTNGSGSPAPAFNFSYADIDVDGDTDLLLEFDTGLLLDLGGIDGASTQLLLEASLRNGGRAFGVDAINVNSKGGGGKGNGKPNR
jgi:hypothetical protein